MAEPTEKLLSIFFLQYCLNEDFQQIVYLTNIEKPRLTMVYLRFKYVVNINRNYPGHYRFSQNSHLHTYVCLVNQLRNL